MHIRLLSSLAIFLFLAACADDGTPEPGETFGAEFSTATVEPAASLSSSYSPDDLSDSVRLTLRGTVAEVCQAKGCWMTITTADGSEMKVTFKDYGFFVPKDISGREVIMHGVAYTQLTSVDELRHFAEDAGESPDAISAIDEPRAELRFLADGVQLLRD